MQRFKETDLSEFGQRRAKCNFKSIIIVILGSLEVGIYIKVYSKSKVKDLTTLTKSCACTPETETVQSHSLYGQGDTASYTHFTDRKSTVISVTTDLRTELCTCRGAGEAARSERGKIG